MASLPSSSTAFTHLLALLTGIAIGKSIHADELNAFRLSTGVEDTLWTRIRRKTKSVLAGGLVAGLVWKTGSMAMRGMLGGGRGREGGGSSGVSSSRAQ